MFIIQAILLARTKCIVYFLLTSWLEGLQHDGRTHAILFKAIKLPIRGPGDVSRRVSLVREQLDRHLASAPSDLRALECTAAALSVACEQLRKLSGGRETRSVR